MLMNNGLANTECAMVINALHARNVRIEALNAYAMEFNLPARHGKVDKNWLTKKRLGKKREPLVVFLGAADESCSNRRGLLAGHLH